MLAKYDGRSAIQQSKLESTMDCPCLTSELSKELSMKDVWAPISLNMFEGGVIVKRLDSASGRDERGLVHSNVIGPQSNPDGGVWI